MASYISLLIHVIQLSTTTSVLYG